MTSSPDGKSTTSSFSYALDVDHWLQATRTLHLTIADVLTLKPGETLECVCVDRNLGVPRCNPSSSRSRVDASQRPLDFFQAAYRLRLMRTVTQRGGALPVSGGITVPTDVAPSALDAAFEPDIEHDRGRFFPLSRGMLPAWHSCTGETLGAAGGMHWRQFPSDTRIGWRGPAMPLARLCRTPHIFRPAPAEGAESSA
jgi:hypothetical protein